MRDFANEMRNLSRKHAAEMRDHAHAAVLKRKEEYLGARVPKALREKVITRANSLGIPVSNLIRNVLEEAFADVPSPAGATQTAEATRRTDVAERFPRVIGWERITLNRPMQCSGCGRSLSGGDAVTLGLAARGDDHVVLCPICQESV